MEANQSSYREIGANIRIVSLNNDRTRKIDGSDIEYEVYFELSGTPPQAWGTLFGGEWKSLNATQPSLWQAARIDRTFLVMRCPLQEVVSTHLPFLKKALAMANRKHEQYVHELLMQRKQRRDVWGREGSAVDAMTKS